jgi:hypothetical protein
MAQRVDLWCAGEVEFAVQNLYKFGILLNQREAFFPKYIKGVPSRCRRHLKEQGHEKATTHETQHLQRKGTLPFSIKPLCLESCFKCVTWLYIHVKVEVVYRMTHSQPPQQSAHPSAHPMHLRAELLLPTRCWSLSVRPVCARANLDAATSSRIDFVTSSNALIRSWSQEDGLCIFVSLLVIDNTCRSWEFPTEVGDGPCCTATSPSLEVEIFDSILLGAANVSSLQSTSNPSSADLATETNEGASVPNPVSAPSSIVVQCPEKQPSCKAQA